MELTYSGINSEMSSSGEIDEYVSHIGHLKSVLLDEQPKFAQKKGIYVYQNFPVLRDVATVMEHPEFYSFYQKYLSKPEKRTQILSLLKVYRWISLYLPERYNAYHKLFVLYTLLYHPKYVDQPQNNPLQHLEITEK